MLNPSYVKYIVHHLEVQGFRFEAMNKEVCVIKQDVMNSRRRNPDGTFTTPNGNPQGPGELRSWIYPPSFGWETEGQLLTVIFTHCQMLNDHELREFFHYNGHIIFDPHSPQSRTSLAMEHYIDNQRAVLYAPTFGRGVSNLHVEPQYQVEWKKVVEKITDGQTKL